MRAVVWRPGWLTAQDRTAAIGLSRAEEDFLGSSCTGASPHPAPPLPTSPAELPLCVETLSFSSGGTHRYSKKYILFFANPAKNDSFTLDSYRCVGCSLSLSF